MAPSFIDPARITDYHIHVYYDPESRDRAAILRQWVEERFPVRMGRWHDVPVGPHVTAMYQIQFTPDLFPTLVPFVMMNRMGFRDEQLAKLPPEVVAA